jgi:hypothetical protein
VLTYNTGAVVAAFWSDRLESHTITESMILDVHVVSPSVSSTDFLRDIFRFDKYFASLARDSRRNA